MTSDGNRDRLSQLDELAEGQPTEGSQSQIFRLIETLLDQDEVELGELVQRYARSGNPEIIRTLAFFLAKWASQKPSRGELAPHVWRMIEEFSTGDDSARANLLTALQLLSMYDALLPEGTPPPPTLVPFLIESLHRGPAVQSAAAAMTARLRADGVLDPLPKDEVDRLRSSLSALRDNPDELLQLELESLSEFLSGS